MLKKRNYSFDIVIATRAMKDTKHLVIHKKKGKDRFYNAFV